MRQIWSEHNKRLLWRNIWVALAETQFEYGLVTPEQVANLRAHMDQVDLARSLEIEHEIKHDLMAEIRVFAEQAKIGGGVIHLGATSMDVEDNADAIRLRQSMDLVLVSLKSLLEILIQLIDRYADTPLIAYTHLQPAEPSTLGYRLALYAQDLHQDLRSIETSRNAIRGKGFKGAVGTGASYAELIGSENLVDFEYKLSEKLDLPFYPVTSQTYPRKQDYTLLTAIAGLGQSLYKLAFDLRILQSPSVGEIAEPFGVHQVGSSAMPFKRNPILAEKINSLGRYLAGLPRVAWDNAAHSLLERTLDNSANRRIILPEAFLAIDEMLKNALEIFSGFTVDEKTMKKNSTDLWSFRGDRTGAHGCRQGGRRQAAHARSDSRPRDAGVGSHPGR